jgi:carbamoyl-phosphate synthase large subunit
MNILITGAGGPAGVCAIKALKGKHSVVAVDCDNLASGLYMVGKSYVVPKANDKEFIPKILEICQKEKISFLIPTVSEELIVCAKNLKLFDKMGVKVAVSNPKSIEIANNKLSTYDLFSKEKYGPKVYSLKNVKFPCVVKPVDSRGSRGFHVCQNRRELKVALDKNKESFKKSLIMEYLNGTEYSIYGISDLNGRPILTIPSKRIHAAGESKKAQIVRDKRLSEVANDIACKLNMVGPWNVQVMDSGDSIKLVEVNPRLAGTTSLIIASGIDFMGLVTKVFMNQKIEAEKLIYTPNIIMTRYNEEVFIKPGRVKTYV